MARPTKLSAILSDHVGKGKAIAVAALADACEVTSSAAHAWLTGEYAPAPDKYAAIARATGIPASTLALAAAGLDA